MNRGSWVVWINAAAVILQKLSRPRLSILALVVVAACGASDGPEDGGAHTSREQVGERRAALEETATEDFSTGTNGGPWPAQWSTQTAGSIVDLVTTAIPPLADTGLLARLNGWSGGYANHWLLGRAPTLDSDQSVDIAFNSNTTFASLVARRSGPETYYGVLVGTHPSVDRLRLLRATPGDAYHVLKTAGANNEPMVGAWSAASPNTWYHLRLKVTQTSAGALLQSKLWQGPTAPTGWTLEYTDPLPVNPPNAGLTALQTTPGYNGIGASAGTANNKFIYYDNYRLDGALSANVCTSDAACASGRYCSQAGECRPFGVTCSTNAMCGAGQSCQESQCACPVPANGCVLNGGPAPTLADLMAGFPSLNYRKVTYARDTTDYFALPTPSPIVAPSTGPVSPELKRSNHFILNVPSARVVSLTVDVGNTTVPTNPFVDVLAYDATGTTIKRGFVDSKYPARLQSVVDLGTLAAGNYELDIAPRDPALTYTVKAADPGIVVSLKGGADLANAGQSIYFYVPAEAETAFLLGAFDPAVPVQFFPPETTLGSPDQRLFFPSSTPVTASVITPNVYALDTKGKPGVWRAIFRTTSSRAHFVNLPDVFSFEPRSIIASKRIRTAMTSSTAGSPTAVTSPNLKYNNRFAFHVSGPGTPAFSIGTGSALGTPPHLAFKLLDSTGVNLPGSPFDINPNGTIWPIPLSSLQAGDYELHVLNPSIYNGYSVTVPPNVPFVSVDGYGLGNVRLDSYRAFFTVPAGTTSVFFAAKPTGVPIDVYNPAGAFLGEPIARGNFVYEIQNTTPGTWAINLKGDVWSDIRLLNVPQIISFNSNLHETTQPGGIIGCITNADCPSPKVCGHDNGADFGLPATADVCWLPTCGTAQPSPGSCGSIYADCGVTCPLCQTDADCPAPKICAPLGASFGLARGANVCTLPACLTDKLGTGCGYNGAPCGACDDAVPCTGDTDCPGGDVCVQPGGACVAPGCLNDPVATGCGTVTDLCGECSCTPSCATKSCGNDPSDGCYGTCKGFCGDREGGCLNDADCPVGDACVVGGGPRVGLATGVNVCLPQLCTTPSLQVGRDCGEVSSTCGLCPAPSAGACAGRNCGLDPNTGVRCGPDGPGCIQGRLLGAFNFTDLDLQTIDRENGTVRTIEPLPAPDDAAVAVGAVDGTFEVNQRGNAIYSIPINVPPGRAGIEPHLSLVYNSANGNGLVGMGWTLGGLSSVSRCSKTSATDGWAERIKFDETDALCLDGQRLIWVSGSPGLNPGAEYRTELDSFEKVTMVSEEVQGITEVFFRGYRKDGLIYEYGRTDFYNERAYRDIPGRGIVVRSWALSRIRDRIGNFINIEYGKTEGVEPRFSVGSTADTVELFPTSIAYGGIESPRGNVAVSRVVTFDYDTNRNDYMDGYTSSGSRIARKHLLTAVRTRVLDQDLRSYELTYEQAPSGVPETAYRGVSGPSRLTSITECSDKNGSRSCKPPSVFTYTDQRGFHPNTVKTTLAATGTIRGPLINFDFNGDGAEDLLAVYDLGDAKPYWVVLEATGERVGGAYTMVAPRTSGNQPEFLFVDRHCFSQQGVDDLDGDGRDDILDTCRRNGATFGEYDIWEGTGDEQNPLAVRSAVVNAVWVSAPRAFLTDVDGDGMKDLFECGIKSTYDATKDFNPLYVEEAHYYRGRLDGTFVPSETGLTSRLAKDHGDYGQGSLWGFCFSGPHFVVPGQPTTPMFVRDVTGDGISDLLLWKPSHIAKPGGSLIDDSAWARYVVEPGGESAHWEQASSAGGVAAHQLLDVNGDGLVDWLSIGSGVDASSGAKTEFFQVALNVGGIFGPAAPASLDYSSAALIAHRSAFGITNSIPIDYDGDGAQDLVHLFQPRAGDPPTANRLWLWDRTNSDAAHHGTLELDPALRDLANAELHALAVQPNIAPPSAGPIFSMADVDGDGSPDLVQIGDDRKIAVTYGQFGRENLLKTVVNGVGKRIEIRYDTKSFFSDGTEEPTFKPERECRHRNNERSTRCVRQVGPLVSEYTILAESTTHSWSADSRVRYRYENARQGLFGRGWLGFEKTTIERVVPTLPETFVERDEVTFDNQTFDSRWRVFPFAGLVTRKITTTAFEKSVIERESAAGQIEQSSEWSVGISASGRPFPFVRGTTASRNEVLASGSVLNVLTNNATSLQVDGYGNVWSSNESTSTAGVTRILKTHAATFDESEARLGDWLTGLKINQVDEENTFLTASDKPYEVRETSWSYDGLGLLSSMTREPSESHESSLYLRTTYRRQSDDVFQNVRSVEIAGNWQEAGGDLVVGKRVQSLQYDDGMFLRRVIHHVGSDCPVDQELKDDANAGFGTTCLLVDTRLDPRDATLLGRVDESGVGTQFAYDAFGRVRRQVSAAETRNVAYDLAEPSYDAELHSVPATTQVFEQNETTGATSIRSFDALGRTVQTEASGLDGEPVFQEVRYRFGDRVDTLTRPHAEGDSTQGHITYNYDARWRLVGQRFPNETETQSYRVAAVNVLSSYAPQPSEVTVSVAIDPSLNQEVAFADCRGSLLRATDAKGGTTKYVYDVFGTLARITDASGNLTQIETDRLGRVVSHADADTGLQTYQHTAFDQPFIHEDGVGTQAPRKRLYRYDELGRLAEVTTPDADTQFTYDVGENAKGRLVESAVATESSSPQIQHFEYQKVPNSRNPMENLAFVAEVSQQTGGVTYATSYSYNARNQLERVAYPESSAGRSFAVRYGYDSVGNINTITGTSADGTSEDALFWRQDSAYQGQAVLTETLGDQLITTYAYEAKTGRIKGITTGASASDVIQDIQYLDYDDNGNVTHRTSAIRAPGSSELELVDEGFDYDELGRLDHIREGSTTTRMGYDGIGNITSKPGVGSYNYVESGKQFRPHAVRNIVRDDATVLSLDYDDYGNVSHRSGEGVVGGSQSIEYTSFNLPRKITLGNGDQLSYSYDASDARVTASSGDCSVPTSAGCSQRVYVGQAYERLTGTDPAGRFTRHTYRVLAGGRQVAEVVREKRAQGVETEARRYLHADGQGSPQLITDDSANVVATLRHSPFGERVGEAGEALSLGMRSDFTGHELDVESGLVNMGGRLYDARLGRFMQADPAGMETLYNAKGLNRYAYVFNNPLNFADPTGFEEAGGWSDSVETQEEMVKRFETYDRELAAREAMAAEHPFAEGNADQAQADALWEIINGEGSQAMHAPTGNPNMDLVGIPLRQPSPWELRPVGPGDKFNPYDDHRPWTSLFGQENRPANPYTQYQQPGSPIYELSPVSDVIALLDDKASGSRKAVAIISLIPFGAISKIGKLGGEVIKGAEALGGIAARGAEEAVSVFHGSINNGANILEHGLDATRAPTFVSRDLAAAQNALLNHPNAVPGLGQVIESRIPVSQFNQFMAPFERPYSGFYPYGLQSTEITLRSAEQIQIFNQFIVR